MQNRKLPLFALALIAPILVFAACSAIDPAGLPGAALTNPETGEPGPGLSSFETEPNPAASPALAHENQTPEPLFIPMLTNRQEQEGALSCSEYGFGTLLMQGQPGDEITPADVLLFAEEQYGVKGMAGAGAPSDQVREEWFENLPGWRRIFLRGSYAELQPIDQTAERFGMQDQYECIGYGPESAHQAGEEALDPLTWLPRAAELAGETGKCLVYGPAVADYERLTTPPGSAEPDEAELAALVAQAAPHVDIWMIQIAKYQLWTDEGRSQNGSPYTFADLKSWLAAWTSWIKGANPDAEVWIQLGIGRFDPIEKACLPPQPPEYLLEYRDELADTGIDGLWVMPSMSCQYSQNPQDREYYQQSLAVFQEAIRLACEQ